MLREITALSQFCLSYVHLTIAVMIQTDKLSFILSYILLSYFIFTNFSLHGQIVALAQFRRVVLCDSV